MNGKRERKATLLLADDERGTREVLAKFLRMQYDVTLAEDGEVALNLLDRNDYDIVLTDIRMPGADGFRILEKTLQKTSPPPCIMFTAYGSIETADSETGTPTGKLIIGRLTYKSRKVGIPADHKVPNTGSFKSTRTKSLFGTEEHIIEYDFTAGSDAEAEAARKALEEKRKEALTAAAEAKK